MRECSAYIADMSSEASKRARHRERRAEDTRRWRERLRRGACVLPVEADATTFDLMERFGGLKDSKTGNRGCRHRAGQVAAPRAGGVAARRSCFPTLSRGVSQKRGIG